MAVTSRHAPRFRNQEEAPAVTVEALMRHFKAYGLDNSHTGYRKAAERYTNYKGLREDSMAHVARSFLTKAAYVMLLEAIGYPGYRAEAEADWDDLHGGGADGQA